MGASLNLKLYFSYSKLPATTFHDSKTKSLFKNYVSIRTLLDFYTCYYNELRIHLKYDSIMVYGSFLALLFRGITKIFGFEVSIECLSYYPILVFILLSEFRLDLPWIQTSYNI